MQLNIQKKTKRKSSLFRLRELKKEIEEKIDLSLEDSKILGFTIIYTDLEDEEIKEIFFDKEKYAKHKIKMIIIYKSRESGFEKGE